MTETPRPLTKEEMRAAILEYMHGMVRYWANCEVRPDTVEQRISGFAFSVLTMIDGCTLAIPALNLSAETSEEHKAYMRDEGENWWPTGEPINDDLMLHECWHKAETRHD